MPNQFEDIHTEETDAHGIKTVLHVEFGKPESSYLKFFDPDGNELADGEHQVDGKKVEITRPTSHGEIKHQQLREMTDVKYSRCIRVEGDEWPLVAVVAFPDGQSQFTDSID